MSFQQNSRQFMRIIWLNVFLFALLGILARAVFLSNIADFSTLTTIPEDVFQAFIVGTRFDFRVAAIAFAPIFLIGLVISGSRFYGKFQRLIPYYSFFIYFLLAASAIGNYYYFKTYNNHFDIFIFGLVEDDTASVIATLWEDYPIFRSFLASVFLASGLTFLTVKAMKKIQQFSWKLRPWYISTLSIVLTIIIYFIVSRGSVGTFPLGQYHTNVSQYELLNKVTPNSLIAYNWAAKAHRKDAKFSSVSKAQFNEALLKTIEQEQPTYHTDKNQYIEHSPPNIVLALMESMGTNLLLNDNQQNTNLLASLRQPFEQDFVFDRFVSGANSTIGTLAMLLFHSNTYSISRSSAQNTALTGSVFLPYQQAGYKVVYITGGSPTWRNLNSYLLLQGVDEFYSEIEIKEAFPESEALTNTWGVPDEFAFKFVEKLLAENEQPVVVVMLTQTNHSPYQVPATYEATPLEVSDYMLNKLSLTQEQAQTMLSVFQYSNDALGQFIQSIKNSNAENKDNHQTIIAATGDHRSRSYEIDYPKDLGSAYGVPFYLYVPDAILEKVDYTFEKSRIGSHRDIFPTLYSLSLSNVEYHSLGGRNLLSKQDIESPIAYNESITLTAEGVFNNATPKLLYPWADKNSLQLNKNAIENKFAEFPSNYNQLQTLFINSQIKGFK